MIADNILTRVVLYRKNSNLIEFRFYNRTDPQAVDTVLNWGDGISGKFKSIIKGKIIAYEEI